MPVMNSKGRGRILFIVIAIFACFWQASCDDISYAVFPGCFQYILIGRRMGNVTGVCFEETPFQKSGQPSKRRRMALKAFMFHNPSSTFCFLICLGWATMESLTSFLASGFFHTSAEERKKKLKKVNTLLLTDKNVIGSACFLCMCCPNSESDWLYAINIHKYRNVLFNSSFISKWQESVLPNHWKY